MNSKTDSREKILVAASKLFQVKGYNGTGLNEILQESKAPKGSLYYYFPNGKEELALAAIKLASETIENRLKNVFREHSNPIDAVQAIINNITDDLQRDNKLQDISLSLIALETYLSNESLRNACQEAFSSLQKLYADKLIESGMPHATAEDLGAFIQISIEGAITLAVTERKPAALLAVNRQLTNLLTAYIHR
ncbi:TetR/AcrR family transcriptional regulator [Clostridium oryzae]|uniref:Putative HTH-type transcriptional regulator YxaF n=1 Tax=Clostridium oryzae TaxID=1450648 RepID=A0A1V4IN06_9CLOT|nr:TetR/AcrR family transcriptional regulator [Clostridium oryzae]OPJ61190.1 putative HTH-type transcriptional regulator YxaF [Clostridium oryzae]